MTNFRKYSQPVNNFVRSDGRLARQVLGESYVYV